MNQSQPGSKESIPRNKISDEQCAQSEAKTVRAFESVNEQRDYCSFTAAQIHSRVSWIYAGRTLAENRENLDIVEDQLAVLRSQVREVRRLLKIHAHRRERRENGVYLP